MKPSRPLVRADTLLRSFQSAPAHHIPRIQCFQQTRTLVRRSRTSNRAVENLNLDRMRTTSYDYHVRRRNFLLAGAASGVIAFVYTAYLLKKELDKPKKMDSGLPAGADPFSTEAGTKRKTVLHDSDGREIVPTGNTTIKTFPRTLDLKTGARDGVEAANGVEYTLVGLGTRTVTFLGFEVYVVGYYIATPDIAAIQAKLVKEINSIATTLVPSEREELKRRLLDPAEGHKLWLDILQDLKPRSVFRLVPVRNTDFHHLRDGLVNAITAYSRNYSAEYSDEAFGAAMKDFRAIFNRGSVPKKGELLLARDEQAKLSILYDDGKGQRDLITIGGVDDERVSRALWMNYLAGKAVASEPARQNIVHGIMEFVERPVGTVAAQVV
ncbi:chalcone-flavanone isomerase-domain-containing protein [Xylariales sp. PMI_506]|nr:chalcone-flavanone isomerase-domain-containing protein [Xylariales sp. PMI_506]